jgi:2-amino-4-hydroxy-6-hydroxymethyldihydropteridine diphosphokinase
MSRHSRAYVGLGANLGDADGVLSHAIRALAALPGARLRAVSRLYATVPVGVTDQPEFRNAVAALNVPSGPDPETGAIGLLVALKSIERAFGRADRGRWGPRELDLDLLLFGRAPLIVDRPPDGMSRDAIKAASPEGHVLQLPHPQAHERLFVLAPLADVAPGLVPPGWHETVASAERRRRAMEPPGSVRPIGRWSGDGWVDEKGAVSGQSAPR